MSHPGTQPYRRHHAALRTAVALLAPAAVATPSVVAAQPSATVYMQVVAHPDDDLLFMNPSLQNALGAGFGCVTVVLTAAEAAGGSNLDPRQGPVDTSRAVFASLRQEGLRQAYAYMAGLSPSAPWTRAAITVAGRPIELNTLNAAPHVRLLFVNLYDGGDPYYPPSLIALYGDSTAVRSSFVTQSGVVRSSYTYTHAVLRQLLSELLASYQPSHVNMLDPQPQLICGPVEPGHSCWEYMDDNPDHIAAARFMNEALQSYAGPNGTRRFDTFYHRGYAVGRYRGNLSPTDYTRKRSVCDVYKAYDSNFRAYENNYNPFFGGTYERYWGGTTWLQRLNDGRLAAFAVQGRRVVQWTENSVGGTWTGPTILGDRPVAPHVHVVRYDDGRVRLFALALPVRSPGTEVSADDWEHVVTAAQGVPGGPFGTWENLESPPPEAPGMSPLWVGLPAAAPNSSGRAEVFVRTASGDVSRRVETAGGWSAWQALPDISGDDVQDGIVAYRAVDGRIEVFAALRSGDMAHWRQQAAGNYVLDPAFPVINAASPPTATTNADGRLEIFYREADSAPVTPSNVVTAFFTPSGVWSTNLVDLGGHGGVGPVAAMLRSASGQIMLFTRNNYHGVSALWQGSPNSSFISSWQDLGGIISGFPSAANDATGRVVVAALGTDNMLYIRREVALGVTGSFGAWTAVGATASQVGVATDRGDKGRGPLTARPSVARHGTRLWFGTTLGSEGVVTVYDVIGRVARTLRVEEGATSVWWDGLDAEGRPLASGVYFIHAVAAGLDATTRVAVAR